MRELRLTDQQHVGDNPNQMNLAYLSASQEFAQIAKNQEKLTQKQIDQIKKHKDEKLLSSVTGHPMLKGPSNIKATKTNGNILSWGEPSESTINDEIKPTFKRKYDDHRDKLNSVHNLLSGECKGPVYDSSKNPRTQNLRLHTSSFSFHEF